MIDVIFPVGSGSLWQNNELRFSLRSIEKHLKGFRNVWIIGECPDFLQNIIHIPCDDVKGGVPDTNILRKILLACDNTGSAESFICFNDDHYLMQDFEAKDFPYYYSTNLETYVKKRGNDGYGRRSRNTLNLLKSLNWPTKYFDTHYPIVYNKNLFKGFVGANYDHRAKDGMILKSLYCNALQIEGVKIDDCKVPYQLIKELPCWSSYPTMSNGAKQFLMGKFPQKSKFEV